MQWALSFRDLRRTQDQTQKKRCRLQELSKNAERARRRCTLWSFSQPMECLFTNLASSALTAKPHFKSVSCSLLLLFSHKHSFNSWVRYLRRDSSRGSLNSESHELKKCVDGFVLQLSNYSSMEGVLYCKPHFEQLFKETGSFNKNFQSRM